MISRKIKIRCLFIGFFFFFCLLLPSLSFARDLSEITDWYIKDFKSEITVNKDSSLLITEYITADCGNISDKHGIFRVLPTQTKKTTAKTISTPIELISVTDFNDQPIKYSTINNNSKHTITWKIGDPNKTVFGVNHYKIKYNVKNAIRFDNENFDEFYWNLNGNFWDIETDNYSATIYLPKEVKKSEAEVNLYSGSFGLNLNDKARYEWEDGNTLLVSSTQPLEINEGITLSITFPKNIFMPYKPTFFEKYSQYFWLLIPLFVFIFCYKLWFSYGRDPKIKSAVAPMFEIPDNLSPIDMGILMTNGVLKNNFLSASIINLAVKKLIKIEEIEKKGIVAKKDYVLHLLKNDPTKISISEQILFNKLFNNKNKVAISSLQNKFYSDIDSIRKESNNTLEKEQYIDNSGKKSAAIIGIILFLIFGLIYLSFYKFSVIGILSTISSAIICTIFIFLMSKRTQKGAMAYHKILGFKMYMEMAEKYRQRFNEQENIFEKFLPYAILFNITDKWIKAMRNIYGEKYFSTYHPVWFYGANASAFNANSFTKSLNNVSSSMASTLSSSPSSSGSGGGGFSGGGGGGGGGGGW